MPSPSPANPSRTRNTAAWLVVTTTLGFLLVSGSLLVEAWQLRVLVAGLGMLSLLAGLLLVLARTPRDGR